MCLMLLLRIGVCRFIDRLVMVLVVEWLMLGSLVSCLMLWGNFFVCCLIMICVVLCRLCVWL